MHLSADGWRDDQFPRKIGFVASSLRAIEEIVQSGLAAAYLPDYEAKRMGLHKVSVSGCPYTCEQNIYLIAKEPEKYSWLKQIFD